MPETVVDLARRFEPILYLHAGERFFPSDAKRYLEHCALWRADVPFDKAASWRGPLIASKKIAAANNEVRAGDSYFGERTGNIQRFLTDTPGEERFLDLAGWRFSSAGDGSVTEQFVTTPISDERNRFAHRDEVARRYNATDGEPALRDSRFWYHAELFDTDRLRILMVERPSDGFPILSQVFARLRNPALLCYYFFFPGHDEGLPCGNTEFACFVGEWACMAVLLERDDPDAVYMPTWIGLTSRRNLGSRQGFDERERRVAMTAKRWRFKTDVHASLLPETIEDHPKIFVAGGTHGLHLQPGTHILDAFTPDSHPQECGKFESPDARQKDVESDSDGPVPIIVYKLIAAGLLSPIPFAAVVGLAWALLEGSPGISAVGTASTEDEPMPDVTAGPGNLGKVIHPTSLSLTEPGAELIPWAAEELTIAQRRYGFVVDRNSQVWWPHLDIHEGFRGRWGPRVSLDPFARRAGMRFPEFWRMFFVARAKEIAAGP